MDTRAAIWVSTSEKYSKSFWEFSKVWPCLQTHDRSSTCLEISRCWGLNGTRTQESQHNALEKFTTCLWASLGDRPNTVSKSTLSSVELSGLQGSWERTQRILLGLLFVWKGELTEFTEFVAELTRLAHNSVSSFFQNSALETVFRLFPSLHTPRYGSGGMCLGWIL